MHVPKTNKTAKRSLIALMITIVILPIFSIAWPANAAIGGSSSKPFNPHSVKVLVVSPANTYYKGASYLISDLASYGLDVVQSTSDNATATNYLTDQKTQDLTQYDVVILQGSSAGLPPAIVTPEEVNHFVDYGGILIVIGNALFRNETNPIQDWWDSFSSLPVQEIDQRLGVDFTGFFRGADAPYWHNNGTFTKTNATFPGPTALNYLVSTSDIIYPVISQLDLTTNGASQLYGFTAAAGKQTPGVTYYRNATGAVGIYIQGTYVYARDEGGNQITYYGLADISARARLMASLIAFAQGSDVDTVIKPQPFATVRLANLGGYGLTGGLLQDQAYLNASLAYFDALVQNYNITPTVVFTDYPEFKPSYWQDVSPIILQQLKSKYQDWEYTTSLRNLDVTTMTENQILALIDNIKGNYTAKGINLFGTVIAPLGLWNQPTINAMVNRNLTLLDIPVSYYPQDWWAIRINSSVIVHMGKTMVTENFENFTQVDKNHLNWQYYGFRDEFSFALINGFPEFLYDVRNFRWNEVGTYSLQTVYTNLTSEVPDIRFVPLAEAALYFGNPLMRIENPTRNGSTIDFDVASSNIPEVVSIDKGMLWLRINANQTIQGVTIDDKPWYYFDEHTITLPTPMVSAHLRVTLGSPVTPRVIRASQVIFDTSWDGMRFAFRVVASPKLNVTVVLFVPNSGVFIGDQWSSYSSASQWNYTFASSSRIMTIWLISEGSMIFKLGPDVVPPIIQITDQSYPVYNGSVTITANVTDLQTTIDQVIMGYFYQNDWVNVTMTTENGLYVTSIPACPYGTKVAYRIYASDSVGNWGKSFIYYYNVTDPFPPEIGALQWNPTNPPAGQTVTVEVTVSEPLFASGIKQVSLWYALNGQIIPDQSTKMTEENGIWRATIPGQSSGTRVAFLVEAYDNKGNRASKESSYTVSGGTPPNWQLLILLSLISAAAATMVAIVYLRKVRRRAGMADKTSSEKQPTKS